jgi:hypothetical protein
MSQLNVVQKLGLQVNPEGTVPVNTMALRTFGFNGCLFGNRRCVGAVVIYPGIDEERCTLWCRIKQKYVHGEESQVCQQQQ